MLASQEFFKTQMEKAILSFSVGEKMFSWLLKVIQNLIPFISY